MKMALSEHHRFTDGQQVSLTKTITMVKLSFIHENERVCVSL